jgi:hypothetical protein
MSMPMMPSFLVHAMSKLPLPLLFWKLPLLLLFYKLPLLLLFMCQ